MKTKSIAQAGMLCAVYGVMIFANTLTGLWVESLFPYLFAFPILICAIKQTPQVSLCALVAMFILTLMLGSLTTWLIAGSMLAAGWVFGWGIHQHISLVWTAVFCFGVMTLLNYLEVSVLAAIFGYDMSMEKELFQWISSFLSWNGLLLILSGLMGFLESFALACMSIVVGFKVDKTLTVANLGLRVGIHPWFAWMFTLLLPIWFLTLTGVISCPSGVKDLLVILIVVCFCALIVKGASALVRRGLKKRRPSNYTTLTILGAFIPGVNLIYAAVGWWSLFRHSFDSTHHHKA